MREIKFRMWDKKYKQMAIYKLDKIEHIPLGNMEIMQYTRLKDKNGVEIYEGDIVEQNRFSMTFNKYEVVKYDEGGFSPFAIPEWEVTLNSDEVEVVGNIHENPELLEGLDE